MGDTTGRLAPIREALPAECADVAKGSLTWDSLGALLATPVCMALPHPSPLFPNPPMKFLDSHVHMVSRTTDDYQRMAAHAFVAIIEPSFWQGQPRTEAGSFKDYFNSLIGFERFRASQFGIKHYCTIGLNPKEANNEKLADAVMELLPLYVCKEGVVGVGEIGFDDQTRLEEKYLRLQARIAVEADLPIQIHTPHRDKKVGTSRTMDVLLDAGCDPAKVIIDHNNEETVKEVLDRGDSGRLSLFIHTPSWAISA
ncbi:MAG: TatD family hydrolase [Verrucomicrobiales bacterium]